jgi:hypothetical protein
MKQIRLNDPDDGAWIMICVDGAFDELRDRCIATHCDGVIQGGFAFQNYTGRDGSITVHMAGRNRRWCSRDLLWMCFDYAFNQLGVGKVIAPVNSIHVSALLQIMRAGYVHEASIENVFPGGAALLLLTMTRDQCRWLDRAPIHYRRNYELADGW